jgi:O-antigen/teichoic acid export membrane protein
VKLNDSKVPSQNSEGGREQELGKLVRRGGLANLASSTILALQSLIMTMVISHWGELADVGVFSLGFASANLFLNMGRFGMRNYQVSDADERFAFPTYLRSRIVTVIAMMICAAAYTGIAGMVLQYSNEKMLAIVLLCLLKAEDAFEDVYHGNYQQHMRLDVAGTLLSVRLLLSIVVFALAFFTTRQLNLSLTLSIAVCALFIIWEIKLVRSQLDLPKDNRGLTTDDGSMRATKSLIKDCFPLFIAAFVAFYTVNVPKYAIDAFQGDEVQAIFGYLFMPVFMVNLLASSIFQPQVSQLSKLWTEGKTALFSRGIKRQVVVTIALGVMCMSGAWLIGVPVLDILYKAHLEEYKSLLVLLMAGGCFYALAILAVIGLTIIRAQQNVGKLYIVLSVVATISSWTLVPEYGLTGASLSYTMTMGVQAISFLVILFNKVRERNTSQEND